MRRIARFVLLAGLALALISAISGCADGRGPVPGTPGPTPDGQVARTQVAPETRLVRDAARVRALTSEPRPSFPRIERAMSKTVREALERADVSGDAGGDSELVEVASTAIAEGKQGIQPARNAQRIESSLTRALHILVLIELDQAQSASGVPARRSWDRAEALYVATGAPLSPAVEAAFTDGRQALSRGEKTSAGLASDVVRSTLLTHVAVRVVQGVRESGAGGGRTLSAQARARVDAELLYPQLLEEMPVDTESLSSLYGSGESPGAPAVRTAITASLLASARAEMEDLAGSPASPLARQRLYRARQLIDVLSAIGVSTRRYRGALNLMHQLDDAIEAGEVPEVRELSGRILSAL